MEVLPTLLKGGTVVLEPKFDARRTLEFIEQHRATTISGVPTTYEVLCEDVVWETTELGSVIGVPDEKWGEVPRAVVLLRDGEQLTEDQVRMHLDGRLARYKIPKSVVFVDEMPRTASSKIRKADLRKLSSSQQ